MRWRAALLSIMVGLVGAPVVASPAYAHAQLLSTDPASGQRLSSPPTEIVLRFSEPVRAVPDGIHVLDSHGRRREAEQPTNPGDNPNWLRLGLPTDLDDDYYTVVWRAVSADSHPVNGSFVFVLGTPTVDSPTPVGAGPGAETRTDADRSVVVAFWATRWLGYAGLALLLGGGYFLVVCWPEGRRRRGARRLVWSGWALALVGTVGALALQGPYGAGSSLAGVFDLSLLADTVTTRYGVGMAARVALLAAAALALRRLARIGPGLVGPGRVGRGALAGLAIALPLTWAGVGHAVVGPWFQVGVDTTHLAAMAVWLGGLAVLFTALLPRRAEVPAPELTAAVGRFSRTAIVAVGLLAVTGLVQGWLEVGSLPALTGSAYGQMLFVKVSAFGVLICLGSVSRSLVQARVNSSRPGADGSPDGAAKGRKPRRSQRERELSTRTRLRRSVGVETAIATAVLGLTAALVATPPGTHLHVVPVAGPVGPVAAASPTAGLDRDLALPGGGQVRVHVTPGRAGTNRMTLTVLDPAGDPWAVPEVGARLSLAAAGIGPLTATLTRTGEGTFQASTVDLPIAGGWQLEVLVRTTEVDQYRVTTELAVR